MVCVVLMFEASTPFLKLREALILADATSGALFAVNNVLFSGSFFLARIVFGFVQFARWLAAVEALLAAGAAHSVPLVRMYEVCAGFLTLLNAWWMIVIVRGALASAKPGYSPRAKDL